MGIPILVCAVILGLSLWMAYRRRKAEEEARERKRWERQRRKRSSVSGGKSNFNPGNPRTYRNATQKQLLIDGRPIFRFGSGENWTITT
jgi:hypothetical protein